MFFVLAQIFWFLFRPLNFFFFAALAAGIAGWAGFHTFAVRVLLVLAAGFAAVAFTQLPDWLLHQLEKRALAEGEFEGTPYGIIVLGGGLIAGMHNNPDGYNLGEAGDRMIAALALKRRYPNARFIYSGGPGALARHGRPETAAAQALIEAIAGPGFKAELESRSRNTWQNAVFSAQMIGEARKEDWLLVTSAFHMPRALAAFRKAGINVAPSPADFRADILEFPYLTGKSANQFLKFHIFMREIAGIVAYRLTGRID